jgi:hypothetical protein
MESKKITIGSVMGVIKYAAFIFTVIVLFDFLVLNVILGFGYPSHYEEESVKRFPVPYVSFTGKPNARDHNEEGFRGASSVNAKPEDLRIAFFGGSTGYKGNPPIPKLIESKLKEELKVDIFVANYSVISSNHRQHLHGMIEYLTEFQPDIVVFYGGYNELISGAYYDPRPGYPYNHFYRGETSPLTKVLLENSAIIGEIDKRLGVFSGIGKLREIHQPFSDDWNNRVIDKYFETLGLARKITSLMEPKILDTPLFLSFYQPYQVPYEFKSMHEVIKERIVSLDYAYDVSSEYDSLGEGVYSDPVHVNQEAKEVMAERMAAIIVKVLQTTNLKESLKKS